MPIKSCNTNKMISRYDLCIRLWALIRQSTWGKVQMLFTCAHIWKVCIKLNDTAISLLLMLIANSKCHTDHITRCHVNGIICCYLVPECVNQPQINCAYETWYIRLFFIIFQMVNLLSSYTSINIDFRRETDIDYLWQFSTIDSKLLKTRKLQLRQITLRFVTMEIIPVGPLWEMTETTGYEAVFNRISVGLLY